MFLTHLKIAWRNIINDKGYSFMNILGLTIGLCVAILIGLFVRNELSYDKNFTNYDSIGQVYQTQTTSDDKVTWSAVPRPLEKELRTNYGSYFKYIVMASWRNKSYLKYEENTVFESGISLQNEAPEMFDFEILAGVKRGLDDVNSIMLSETLAKKLFGKAELAIGKVITYDLRHELNVTGVYKNFPKNSSFYDTHQITSWELHVISQEWIKNAEDSWHNNSFQMFFQIVDGVDFKEAEEIVKYAKKIAINNEFGYDPVLHLVPMKDWHLRRDFENGVQTGGNIEEVILFATIGIIVLVLACINFMNLATARSGKRAKEVGVKKTIGAYRSSLVKQFYAESFVVVGISLVLALVLVNIFLDSFNSFADREIIFPWTNLKFWLWMILLLIVSGLFSGSYPALYLSRFSPISVIKGTFVKSKYSGLTRKLLVIFQFVLSVALIIGTIIIKQQMNYVKSRTHGYNMDALIEFAAWAKPFHGKYDFMREQFMSTGAITNMSASNSPITEVQSNQSFFDWEGRPDGFKDDFAFINISMDYVATTQMKILEGRDLSRVFASDSAAVLINKTAQKYMGLKNPIGKKIKRTLEEPEPDLTIIGVLDDVVMGNPFGNTEQTLFVFDRSGNGAFYQMRLNSENTVKENLKILKTKWEELIPEIPFGFQFVDENYAEAFEDEETMSALVSIFTAIAIFISCLGLFGLTSFIAEQRTKEIGIRKSIGASVVQIWSLLSKEFIFLVGLSGFISLPLAYYLMSYWLENFTYRISLSVWLFVLGILTALILSLITVSFHAIKAAKANPVKSLKTE